MFRSEVGIEKMSFGDPLLKSIRPRIAHLTRLWSSEQLATGDQVGVEETWTSSERVTSHLRDETESLLRSRLRAAAFVLFVAFSLFLTVYLESNLSQIVWLVSLHALMIVVMALCCVLLSPSYGWRLPQLRLIEYAVFGLPSLYFCYLQTEQVIAYSQYPNRDGAYLLLEGLASRLAVPWICIMYIYASFIPNTWKRCALHIAPMAAFPILQFVHACLRFEGGRSYFASQTMTEIILWVVVPAITAVFGSHTLYALRLKAAMAREFGSYRLKQKLGKGGMGEVYLAEHKMLKRPCAIKFIHPSHAFDPRAITQFEREVQSTARLTHWNTIDIYDYGHTENGSFYYAMEYLTGMSLQELVESHGPMPVERAIHFLRQVCEALREAHGIGLIHRDIKPGNIFASHLGGVWDVAKLLDFGLVKSTEISAHGEEDRSIVGTPLFAPPEWMHDHQSLDARSDIYSLGAVGFFLVTGRPVFIETTPAKLLFAHSHVPAPSILEIDPTVPSDFSSVIARCLSKAPADRFSSALELEKALAHCSQARLWTRESAQRWWSRVDLSKKNAPAPQDFAETQVLEWPEAV